MATLFGFAAGVMLSMGVGAQAGNVDMHMHACPANFRGQVGLANQEEA
jgi:hypothetical protein